MADEKQEPQVTPWGLDPKKLVKKEAGKKKAAPKKPEEDKKKEEPKKPAKDDKKKDK